MVRLFACLVIISLASAACGSLGAAGEPSAPTVARATAHDPCDEASTYQRRAQEADGEVRAALQRIAESKSQECAASSKNAPAEQK
jgi:hypothetical protein